MREENEVKNMLEIVKDRQNKLLPVENLERTFKEIEIEIMILKWVLEIE